MGRPRKTFSGEGMSLGFRVEEQLLSALDAEAARLSRERRHKVSRTEVIKDLLWYALDQRRSK